MADDGASWSRRFLARLEVAGPALPPPGEEGTGAVGGFEVAAGSVTARVKGSHARPYDVWAEVPVLRRAQWERVERALASDPEVSARLRAGEVPPEVEELVARAGVTLLPGAGELDMECSCPQRVVPCGHLVTVLRVLAGAFDADPFTLLAWRGRPRERLLRHVEALTEPAPAAPGVPDRADDPSLPASPHAYWLGDRPDAIGAPDGHAAQDPDPAPRHLGAPDVVVGRRNLADLLAPLYEAMTTR